MRHLAERTTAKPDFHFTNRLVAPVIGCGLILLCAGFAHAGSATWDLDPGSQNWNTAGNWTLMTVPNGPADTATFDASNVRAVRISQGTEVDGIKFTTDATKPFTITVLSGSLLLPRDLIFRGVGIQNSSAITQNFVTNMFGRIFFNKGATAGTSIGFTNKGTTFFLDDSRAGSDTFFINKSETGGTLAGTRFEDTSTADSGTFTNEGATAAGQFGGFTWFGGHSDAGSGKFFNNGGRAADARGGDTTFFEDSNPASGTFTSKGGEVAGAFGGLTTFLGTTTSIPSSATFINEAGAAGSKTGGGTLFDFGSTAGSGTFTNKGATEGGGPGGFTEFRRTSNAGTDGKFINEGGIGSVSTSGSTDFTDISKAGSSTFTNKGSTIIGAYGGSTGFFLDSSAEQGTFINEGATVANTNVLSNGGRTVFNDDSKAGSGKFLNNGGKAAFAGGGVTEFHDSSTAGGVESKFTNEAGEVTDAHGGEVDFLDSSKAGSANFTNKGGAVPNAEGGQVFFGGSSRAESGIFTNEGAAVASAFAGQTTFSDSSHADSGMFTNIGSTAGGFGGLTLFQLNSSADSAILIAQSGNGGQGGQIFFDDSSTGGTSRVEVSGNGNLDISAHNHFAAMTIGSIAGSGNVFLGANTLTVGSNDLNTEFSGVIQDGGFLGGQGGSLTKIGTGTLHLTGANTYTGDTNINEGVLKVDGSIGTTTSNVFVNPGGTLAGMGVMTTNNVINNGIVMPGDAPGTLTINGDYTQTSNGTLLIDIAGASPGQFSVLNVTGTATLDGTLDLVLVDGFIPMVGDDFTFLNAAALLGSFSRIENQNFNTGTEHWDVSFQGTNLIVTAEAGRVPDQAPTLLLLALSLLSLVSYQQSLRRKRA
jgi:autotransporter-associated beta strand protein